MQEYDELDYNMEVSLNSGLDYNGEVPQYTIDGTSKTITEFCPECGNQLFVVGRCSTCYICGWSKCAL